MSTTKQTCECGMDIGGVLLLVFLVLKMSGLIDWSWWWVLSPLWIWFGLLAVAVVGMIVWAMVNP